MPPTFSFGKIELTADTKQSSSRGTPEADARREKLVAALAVASHDAANVN